LVEPSAAILPSATKPLVWLIWWVSDSPIVKWVLNWASACCLSASSSAFSALPPDWLLSSVISIVMPGSVALAMMILFSSSSS